MLRSERHTHCKRCINLQLDARVDDRGERNGYTHRYNNLYGNRNRCKRLHENSYGYSNGEYRSYRSRYRIELFHLLGRIDHAYHNRRIYLQLDARVDDGIDSYSNTCINNNLYGNGYGS